LDEHLRVVRERGYAVIRNELEPGLVAIAVPVFNEKGKAVAAISVTGPAERIAQENESRISSLMQRELSVNVRPQQEGAA
jgi:IclR family KDG regulon transcriptional repressor